MTHRSGSRRRHGCGRRWSTKSAGTSVRIHGSRRTRHEFPLEWVEQALETLVRMFASQLGADIGRRRIEEVNTRMTGLVDLSLALRQELSLKDLLLRIVESSRQMLGARYAALGVLDVIGVGLGRVSTASSADGLVPWSTDRFS